MTPRFSTIIDARGQQGNIFSILATARTLMRELGCTYAEVQQLTDRVTRASSYAAALAVVRECFNVDLGDD